MSMPRALMQAGVLFLMLFAVLLGYKYVGHCLVERANSEAKKAPPVVVEMKPLEFPEFKGLDGIIYNPDRDRFGNR